MRKILSMYEKSFSALTFRWVALSCNVLSTKSYVDDFENSRTHDI